ncbi:MAG: hypothetical protein ACD_30C00025G0004 [uncultured bacterium]|uniref:Peptidase S11 D-alanyl-D-alanine carboxypeptidase A N-terminal domain-containing protein n=3 Tax=Candidatus Daviesiibacteriota TaxID=1752718 RepID=A0A0G0F8K3_9BACT|nr:MAG: hypothetical protein ACD_30C00025G0004 [uncultured bacterium]KKQ09830.1 MAG: hypothetical protein US19_C0010G0008 [Candidatus Daviesbacteria bacterium GW2011_GWB1_36_5]KKQ16023.1 MAG: hypothetical protein US28_C0006G0018 [Candidatus Daviesbacteria bacterium GW2011_GWA1_36_8]OGE31478.1 MAG: hypothetical protein A3C99_02430 [Candidatus Daviesbacteria bacterium RIFCSPHIGHO2_02_FULL_37_9]OGE36358.1 MAG: hypothetical protein A3E66_05685 [Candidatus Daviesbacteria bacterium RIFCSPHIGHO2_12_FU
MSINDIATVLEARWKVFAITFLAGFFMVALPYLGFKTPEFNLANPAPQKINNLEIIKTKLEQTKPSDFNLKTKTLVIPKAHGSQDYEALSAYAVVDLDNGEVIAEKNLETRLPIASITKLMTAIVAIDLISYDRDIHITEKMTQVEPTNMGLISGQSWKRDELLNALLLTSSNDAAQALKEEVDREYGEGSFVSAMNLKAQKLKLKNTQFDNPQGYDSPNNFSSVEDLSIMSSFTIDNYSQISEIVKKDYQFFRETGNHKQADLYNWNGLLGVYPGVEGIKIGNTENAKKTTLILAERSHSAPDGASRNKRRILVVVLGAPGVLERDLWASKLLDLGFGSFGIEPVNITKEQLKQKYSTWKYF